MHDLSAAGLDVSRETLERLTTYCAALSRWSSKINLIAPASDDAVWQRHIIDSAQLFHLGRASGPWVDLGSGGGLPALVLAIVALEASPGIKFHLVESDARKAAFLRIVAADLALNVDVHRARAEALAPLGAQTVSARALAPLEKLLAYVERHLNPSGVALLHKGRNYQAEVDAAAKIWTFDLDLVESVAEQGGKILCIRHIRRRVGNG